ncbi:MAG: type II toxin-antitoxin system PemK/MazF family toxin [Candidatus Azobacteroides sp.]|nr:type II toxin-antitoxin system PemK/MazF family toxin [Candidatus Azobacteroides sp.]
MKKGSVILIPFPFTDLRGSKIRPAVVLCRSELDVTICFITSDFKWKTEYDISVFPSECNGLKVPSLIRTGKIATIDATLALGELGELSNLEIAELDKCLKKLLQL